MKIFVGLSGGVDSAVAAHLLKEQGHTVVGAFIKGWEPDFLPCTGAEDRLSAMRVAAHLQIPFITVDLSDEYKRLVVDPFVDEYRKGRTPNPDVWCNRTIKFGAFWNQVKKRGADAIATGHYAGTDGKQLHVSNDETKDQTYFLWTLTQEDLAHTHFPLGALRKSKVRDIAKRIHLPNALRPDSQGLCFLGHVDMHAFLKRFIEPEDGPILHDGVRVGTHDGVWYYTLGQHVSTNSSERLYVVSKDLGTNTLQVATKLTATEPKSFYTLTTLNWVSGTPPVGTVEAQYRYHGSYVRAQVEGVSVTLDEPVLVAPGQSLVFYSNGVCLGGGTIE
ncbi:MAG: tRNA 2-thiouridine(34) synthase MnmA [Candidatus Pacebacteria bacterium]|nr:tRNA 2-thiouridine(34) synthase MnmA [Candidatus Paceibacterota bacterium]